MPSRCLNGTGLSRRCSEGSQRSARPPSFVDLVGVGAQLAILDPTAVLIALVAMTGDDDSLTLFVRLLVDGKRFVTLNRSAQPQQRDIIGAHRTPLWVQKNVLDVVGLLDGARQVSNRPSRIETTRAS